MAKLSPEAEIRLEHLVSERERAVRQITECNAFIGVVGALEGISSRLPADDDLLGPVHALLSMVRPRAEAMWTAMEETKAAVLRLEEDMRALEAEADLSRYTEGQRERAEQLYSAMWREIGSVQAEVPLTEIASLGGRVFRLRFERDRARRAGDAEAETAAVPSLALLEPALEAGKSLAEKAKQKTSKIRARYRRRLRELRG